MTDDRYTEWDGPYVLGALSAADRREYEEHLTTCDQCSRDVAGLAGMPGLLAALPTAEAVQLLDAEADTADTGDGRGLQDFQATPARLTPPPELLPALSARVRRTRRRRLGWTIGTSLAAAAVVAGAIVVPTQLHQDNPTSVTALSATVPTPIKASVAFTSESWGTRIDMNCLYQGEARGSGSAHDSSWKYGLYVVDGEGTTTRVATWTADPGSEADASGSIDTALSNLTRVEVRNESSGTVLLASALKS